MLGKRANILIVDSDLSFVFWLGQTLDAAGHEAIPAKNIGDAKRLISELGVLIDVLIMRQCVAGANAFTEALRRAQQGRLKTIGLLEEDEVLSEADIRMDAWQHKPLLGDEGGKSDCLELIHCVLAETIMAPILSRAAG